VAESAVKALVIATALLGCVACGDTTAPSTQSEASPSAGAIATPSSSASAAPAPAQTVVTFLNAPLTVPHGQNATLQARTTPNTSCSIEVDYASGPSTAAGLVAKTSDGGGNVSWTWKVGTNTTRGSWPITVTCGSGSAQTHITVT
jgi:micrococcal nuclease